MTSLPIAETGKEASAHQNAPPLPDTSRWRTGKASSSGVWRQGKASTRPAPQGRLFPSLPAVAVRVPFLDLRAQYAGIREQIVEAVQGVIESAHYVGGVHVERFEEEFARYVGARYAVAVGSGTTALELTLRALRIGPGDEVIVPAYTFFATAEAVSLAGAKPVFADVDPVTCHLDAASVERCMTSRTRAIIPVHLHGRAMDLSRISQLAAAGQVELIEDACQAHGARLAGVRVGGSGRPACFSFYPGKNLGAYGDGGAITLNDPALAQSLRILRDHGSPAKYQHIEIGTNSRLDALQAAALRVKLRWLDEWNGRRARHAKAYRSALEGAGVDLPACAPTGGHNYHLFIIRTQRRDALRAYLAGRGIETGIHYPAPLHLTPAYQALGYPGPGSLPVAERLTREVLSLPMFPELTHHQIRDVAAAIREFNAQQPEESGAHAPLERRAM
jgi:dTDP-4-amino-4,6-dideoxygalactose transaminase